MSTASVTPVQRCLNALRAGDPAARHELLAVSRERLVLMTRKMLSGYPGVRRWEDTDDVLQNVLIRLDRALSQVPVDATRDFLRLAAAQIRRELIDLARHYFGPEGLGANYATPHGSEASPEGNDLAIPDNRNNPAALMTWSDLHEAAAALPDDERETFDLLWYHGLTQAEAAAFLGVTARTVRRRWQEARLRLGQALGGEPPL